MSNRSPKRSKSDSANPVGQSENELAKHFLAYLRVEKGLSLNTLEAYQKDINKLNVFARNKEKDLLSIEKDDLVQLLIYLKDEKGMSDASLVRTFSVIRSFYEFMLSEGFLNRDPTNLIETRKSWQALPYCLNSEEVEKLLAQPDVGSDIGLRDKAMLEVLYASGLRVSELINLKLSDVDWDKGLISCFGKGAKHRKVPIGKIAINYLKLYHAARQRLLHGKSSNFLFIGKPHSGNFPESRVRFSGSHGTNRQNHSALKR